MVALGDPFLGLKMRLLYTNAVGLLLDYCRPYCVYYYHIKRNLSRLHFRFRCSKFSL